MPTPSDLPSDRRQYAAPSLVDFGKIYAVTAGDPVDPDGSGPLGPACEEDEILIDGSCLPEDFFSSGV